MHDRTSPFHIFNKKHNTLQMQVEYDIPDVLGNGMAFLSSWALIGLHTQTVVPIVQALWYRCSVQCILLCSGEDDVYMSYNNTLYFSVCMRHLYHLCSISLIYELSKDEKHVASNNC